MTLNPLRYCVGNSIIKPNPEQMKPLHDLEMLNMIKRMSAYYGIWITELWDKLQPFVQVNWFPLNKEALQVF